MIKKYVLKRAGMACAILCLGLVTTSARASGSFSFDDIHYWIGEGTNRAGIVIDWNNGRPRSSLAWGIRWNGVSTNVSEWLKKLAHEDRRLKIVFTEGLEGAEVYGFAYDADGDGGFFNMNAGLATDSDDFIAVSQSNRRWVGTRTNTVAFVGGVGAEVCSSQIDALFPADEDWVGFKFTVAGTEKHTPTHPSYAESPYAFEVSAYYTNLEEFELFEPEYRNIHPETVLGRPSSVCPSWEDNGYVFPEVNITPHSQAFGTNQVFSMASCFDANEKLLNPGFITVKFDHKVLDDPQNPFGLDFIVFGNAFLYMGGDQYFDGMADPNLFFDNVGEFDEKPGLVEVSQDGANWFAYVEGPYANTFAPTISHLYNTNSPDASLFPGNRWWGELADPTLPVDPSLKPRDFYERSVSVAEYATLFNGSSGGTGFDIGGFDLPLDDATGLKWIQYVRVTTQSSKNEAMWTAIDGFADVSPAMPYDNWARKHYAWTDLPNRAISGKEVLAANGKPNCYNAAFGTAPNGPAIEEFTISAFFVEDDRAIFRVPSAACAYDAFRVSKASDMAGIYSDHLPVYEGAVETEAGFESVFSIPVEADAEKAFYKIGISAK